MPEACRRPGCKREILPVGWACRIHWNQLPKKLRSDLIWAETEKEKIAAIGAALAYWKKGRK